MKEAFKAGKLEGDFAVVVRGQGPVANGMPELHALTPLLSVLLGRGHKVLLITDGRMSGASGRVPSAIHLSPEAVCGGAIACLHDGDTIDFDATKGTLNCVSKNFAERVALTSAENAQKIKNSHRLKGSSFGLGRELFTVFRQNVSSTETGATLFDFGFDWGANDND